MSRGLTVQLDATALAGGDRLETGTYQVTLDEATATIRLTRGVTSAELPALERGRKAEVRKPSVDLRSVEGEARWLIVVRMPPAVEWVASLDRAP